MSNDGLDETVAGGEVAITEPLSCHIHVLTCLNPEVPQSGTCGEMTIDSEGIHLNPRQARCTMWKSIPQLSVKWRDLRELKNSVADRGKFSGNFGVGCEGHPKLNLVLRVQLKDTDEATRGRLSRIFDGLPSSVRAGRCPNCGGPVMSGICTNCHVQPSRIHRKGSPVLIVAGALFVAIGIVATLVSYKSAKPRGFFLFFWGAIIVGGLMILRGLFKLLFGRRFFLE